MGIIGRSLVDQLQSKLEFSRIKGASDGTKVARALVEADTAVVVITLELRVVPGVEGVRAELDAAAPFLANDEALEE